MPLDFVGELASVALDLNQEVGLNIEGELDQEGGRDFLSFFKELLTPNYEADLAKVDAAMVGISKIEIPTISTALTDDVYRTTDLATAYEYLYKLGETAEQVDKVIGDIDKAFPKYVSDTGEVSIAALNDASWEDQQALLELGRKQEAIYDLRIELRNLYGQIQGTRGSIYDGPTGMLTDQPIGYGDADNVYGRSGAYQELVNDAQEQEKKLRWIVGEIERLARS